MNIYGFTSWGWGKDIEGKDVRLWKFYKTNNFYIATNDTNVLLWFSDIMENQDELPD